MTEIKNSDVVEILRSTPKKKIDHDSDMEYENQIKERLSKAEITEEFS